MNSISNVDIKVSRIYPLQTEGALRAFADIVINDALLVKGVKVLNGRAGMFVSMPQEKSKDDKWYDAVRCLNQDVRMLITTEVLQAYERQKLVVD